MDAFNKTNLSFLVEETKLENNFKDEWESAKEYFEENIASLETYANVIAFRNEQRVKDIVDTPDRCIKNAFGELYESAISRKTTFENMIENANFATILCKKPISYKDLYNDVKLESVDGETVATFKSINSDLVEEMRTNAEHYIDMCKDCLYDSEIYDKSILESYLPALMYINFKKRDL